MSIAKFSTACLAAMAAMAVAGAAAAAAAPSPAEKPSRQGLYSIYATPTYVIVTGTAPVDESELAAFSGGAEMVAVTNQNLTALNTGNSVNAASVVNGQVSIDANAFSGFAGLGNFVINTGNNNNLQGSMSVNIIMTPP